MKSSRRECCLSAPALLSILYSAARPTFAQGGTLPSRVYEFDSLPVHAGAQNTSRPVLQGLTHAGCPIELHESDLVPGGMPHPAHHHAHEEIFLVRQGTLEVTIAGHTSRLGPGSVALVSSNQEHGVRNPGPARAQYFVLALGAE
jgi:mannose-6-phosphate isomerase-like protein (cupin superfamily)